MQEVSYLMKLNMKMNLKRLLALMLAWLMLLASAALAKDDVLVEDGYAVSDNTAVEWGYDYFAPDDVALYLYAFGELPPNYLTKNEARDLGWVSSEGNLWEIGYGLCIGGDVFGNREKLLPNQSGRTWYECDVNYDGGYRGGERIVFATDGLIYYTGDHYESFTLLYDGWYDEDYRYGETKKNNDDDDWWWLW